MIKFKSTFPFFEVSSSVEESNEGIIVEDFVPIPSPASLAAKMSPTLIEKIPNISYPVQEIVEYLWKNKKKLGYLEKIYFRGFTKAREVAILDIPHNKAYTLRIIYAAYPDEWEITKAFSYNRDLDRRDGTFKVYFPKGYPSIRIKNVVLKSSLDFKITKDERNLVRMYMKKYEDLISRSNRMKESRINREARKRLGEAYND